MILNSDFGKRRVVIYARVSTEHEAQISALENQLDWYKPILAARPEWELVGQYIDEGITGTSAEKRPQFMKMIRDAKQKKFDMIITREVSRFARNTVDTLQYTRELKAKGVEVYFLNDNIKTFDGDGELRLTIMATLAQDESRKTSVRVKSGQLTSMQNGTFYGNGNILGYRRSEMKLDGGKKQVDFIIDPEQAETVRLIFELYLAGYGLVKIKDELERRGRKTACGKERWYTTNIGHILKNSFYCGIITYRKEYVPDYLTQKKIKNYGEVEQIKVQGRHEPIITVEDFERVQAILESKRCDCKNITTGRKAGKKPRTVVWGKLLVCECGHGFSLRAWKHGGGTTNSAYLCYSIVHNGSYSSRQKRGLPTDGYCQTPMIPVWKLQMMAKHIFKNYLTQKDKVLALANSMLEAHIGDSEETVDNTAQIEDYKRELMRVNKRIDNLIEMRSDGEIDKADFVKRKTEAEQKHLELQTKIAELEAEQNKTTPIIDYKEKLEVLRYALEQYANGDDEDIPDSVIEAFVVKIVASKDGFDWYLRFDGDPNDPLQLKVKGKRRTNTTIIDPHAETLGKVDSNTGCYQRYEISHNPTNKLIPLENQGDFCYSLSSLSTSSSTYL